MLRIHPVPLVALTLILCTTPVLALSRYLSSPEIHYPAGFNRATADAVAKVITDKQYKYVDGLTSYWPPAWSTTLVYSGDAKALQSMIAAMARIEGMNLRITFAKDLARESGTGHSVGNWWVMYSHETPKTLTLRINLAAVDVSQLEIPVAQPAPRAAGR